MIKAVNNIPKRRTRGCRMDEINRFLASGEKYGQYKSEPNESIINVYHAFKNAMERMKIDDKLTITLRGKELYFIRRDK